MADLKLMLLVNLKVSSTETISAGSIFEGTLDTFPEDIRQEYLNKRWNNIRVLNDAKGQPVPQRMKTESPIKNKATVQPLRGKTPDEDKFVPKGIEPPTSVIQGPSSVSIERTESKKVSKSKSGTKTIKAEADAEYEQKETVEKSSGTKAETKLVSKPKIVKKIKKSKT